MAAVVGLVTFGSLVVPGAPAGAASEVSLTMTSGFVQLRGADEPILLEDPTTFVADEDPSGSIFNGTLTTPALSFGYPVEELNTTAFIDAAFSQAGGGHPEPGHRRCRADEDGPRRLA